LESIIQSLVDACLESKELRSLVIKQLIKVSETLVNMLVAYDRQESIIKDYDTLVQGMKQILMEETKNRGKKIEEGKVVDPKDYEDVKET
jgi:hypothetical protein